MRFLYTCLIAVPVALSGPAMSQTFGPFEYDPENVLAQAYNASQTVLWSDFDSDGDLDLAVGNAYSPTELFVNSGDGVYNRRLLPEEKPIDATGGAWADFDGDGYLDLLMCGLHAGGFIYWQGSDGIFDQSQFYYGGGIRDCSVADVSSDGRPDVLIVHRGVEGLPSTLLTNQGDRTFQVHQRILLDDGSQSSWADVDGDGDLDLYHGLNSNQPDRLFINEAGVLRAASQEVWPLVNLSSQGGAWADYDADGDFDLYVSVRDGGNVLYRNDSGIFSAIVADQSGNTFGSAWGDVNNDGYLDWVSIDEGGPGRLQLGNGTGWEELAIGDGTEGFPEAVTLVDHDEDGDLDLFVAYGRSDALQQNRVFLNMNETGHWLQVAVSGRSGGSALGAKVTVYDQSKGSSRAQVRAVLPRSGRRAQTGSTLHFGLGEVSRVDSVLVQWPNGSCSKIVSPEVDRVLRVREAGISTCSKQVNQENDSFPSSIYLNAPSPNPSFGRVRFEWRALTGEPYTLEVVNMLGQIVYRVNGRATGEMDSLQWHQAEQIGPGSYALRLQAGGKTVIKRFTVAR